MRRFGLVGNPLTHSWSEKIFVRLFRENGLSDCRYDLYPRENLDGFREWVAQMNDLQGLNVTIPFKLSILAELDETDLSALSAGAVNTIRIFRDSGTVRLKGFNTDTDGFRGILPAPVGHKSALVLGTGGASKAVAAVLKEAGIPFSTVSRKPVERGALSYGEMTGRIIQNNTLIINATPLGMFPETNTFPPIPYRYLTERHLLVDLVYNPPETLFLKFGREQGAKVINGLGMLEIQAQKSLEIFIAD